MRLLRRLEDGKLEFTRYLAEDVLPNYPYAILSHTWLLDNEDEVTFQDFVLGKQEYKPAGYAKIKFCAERAAADGLEYLWVDTCCINKGSSEELLEAITNMFAWYRNAAKCYAYLADVSTVELFNSETMKRLSTHSWEPAFRSSRWFTRGWTLQELLAPLSVEFFSVEHIRLGDKRSLEQCIYEITGIPHRALQGYDLSSFTVEERFEWAANRHTKRKEDRAYCLLGIFNVFMPHMYGEGEHAFDRLRENIERRQSEDARQDQIMAKLPLAAGAAFDSENNQHQPKCLPRTRAELLAKIDRWINQSDDKFICWLNGVAGTGKSTVARTVANAYYARGRLGASFFFSRGSGDLSNANRFFTSLARQLAKSVPQTRRYICDAITRHKNLTEQSLREQWKRLIMEPLSSLDVKMSPSPLLFVIDALDECDNERDIRDVLRILATARSLENIRVRILISSRPELPIHLGFISIPGPERHIFVLHEEPPVRVNRDIQLFFEDHFEAIRKERGLSENWPEPRVVQALVEKSCGLFIWASTACRFIREGSRESQRRISILIDEDRSDADPKRHLDQIYTTVLQNSILKHCSDIQNLRETLGRIVVLFSPLSVEALAALLNGSFDGIQTTLASLHTIVRLSSKPSAPIHLHHPTFRDFILDKSRCSVPDLWVSEKQMHKGMADNCLDYISKSFQSLHTPVNSIESHGHTPHISLALRYACLYWVEHYRRSGTHLSDGDRAHLFFKQHFHRWLQVMNSIGKGSEMGALIRLYHSLLTPADNIYQLPLVKDARRYIVTPNWKDESKDEFNYVNELAFTPDGRYVASGSKGEAARLWNMGPVIKLHRLEADFTQKVSCVRISPDGTLLATGSDDCTLKIWDLDTMTVRYTLKGHSGWVNAVVFSPDGNFLASGSMDEKIVLWDTAKGTEIKRFDNQSSCVNSISFSPDGSLIASGSVDDVVRLWDVSTNPVELHRVFDGHEQCVNSVKYSPDGLYILSGSDDATVKLWNTLTGVCRTFKGHSKKISSVAFSPDCSMVASGSEDMTVRIWDASNGASLRTLRGHTSGINAVAFSPAGDFLASGSFDDEVRLWDTESWTSTVAPNDLNNSTPNQRFLK